jgi:demethylmenaquinone methyltransferase/2-methoxy-6-polyprenyl-1,4-benzoquinol methylase
MESRRAASRDPGEEIDFGFDRIPRADKQPRVDAVFHSVARRYDLMNDLMSAGLHRIWKDAFAAMVKPSRRRLFLHLDVAGGTGDIAFRIAAAGGAQTAIHVLDINAAMLAVGRERAVARRFPALVDFIQGNAEDLPFPEKCFHAFTIAFGIRNVTAIERALAEAYRVLKRGGRFLCLEFSEVDIPGLDQLYDAYSFSAIPALGRTVTGDGESYRYLVESIRNFPRPEAFAAMIEQAGFHRVSFMRLSGGIVAIHSGWKL